MNSKNKIKKNESGQPEFRLRKRLVLSILSSIFVSEVLIMLILNIIKIRSHWIEAPIDSLLLTIIILPTIYYFVIRPLTIQIDKRKLAEERLNRALGIAESTLDSIHNGILVVSNQGDVIRSNAKFAEMWRIPTSILTSSNDKSLQNFILDQLADPDWFTSSVNELYSKPEAESSDSIYFKDGRIFRRISKPFFIEGKPNGRVWSFFDITERKQMEEALRKSEAHFRTLVQTIPDLVWLKDSSGVYLSCNKMFENLIGDKEANIVGKTDYDFFERDQAEFFRENDRKAIAAGKPVKNEEWLTCAIDGRNVLFDVIKTPMFDFQGVFIGVLGIGHDITKRKQTEAEIKLKNDELLKMNSQKDKFLAIIAHDLRSPFTSLLGLSQILYEEMDNLTMEEIKEMANDMRGSAGNLYSLLENLLQWARAVQGLIPYEPEIVRLRAAVDESLATVFDLAGNKKITINYNIPDDIQVFADINIIRTVIRNLTTNAVKFTPKGGKILISAKLADEGKVEISVKDSGIGMSREMVANLFRLDVSTGRKGTEGESSTGLGLMICKNFIEKEGEQLQVESEEGVGSTFLFKLAMNNNR